jgi:MOSC domain-containing protein YiiM
VATSKGRIKAISISTRKGIRKTNVAEAAFETDHGIVGDAHAGRGNRQISLLSVKSIDKLRRKGPDISPGDFAENLTTEGLDLATLRPGTRLRIGRDVELEVTQLGKKCHGRCAIFQKLGDCIMPRDGIFARVTRSGLAKVGDIIEVIND